MNEETVRQIVREELAKAVDQVVDRIVNRDLYKLHEQLSEAGGAVYHPTNGVSFDLLRKLERRGLARIKRRTDYGAYWEAVPDPPV